MTAAAGRVVAHGSMHGQPEFLKVYLVGHGTPERQIGEKIGAFKQIRLETVLASTNGNSRSGHVCKL
jgi:hypothetical protein